MSFGFSGFLISWLHFPIATAACFAPAVLYAFELLVERRTFGRFAFGACVWAAMQFGGHPETAAHLGWLTCVFLLWTLFVERTPDKKQIAIVVLGAIVVGALLAAPYLTTFLETAPKSKRMAELKAAPLQAGGLAYSDRLSAVLLLQPHIFGQVPFEIPWGPAEAEGLSGFAGILAFTAWIANICSVVSRRAWRSREMLYAILTLFFIGVMFNWPVVSHVFHWTMPIAAHTRVRLLFVLLASLQSAAAIDLARRVPLLAGVAATAALLLLIRVTMVHGPQYRIDTAILGMFPGMAVLLAATLAAITRTRTSMLLLLTLVTAELFAFGRMRPTPLDERTLYPRTPLLAKLQELAQQQPRNQPFRIAGLDAQLFPNTAALFGFEDIRAHDPMAFARYAGFLGNTANYTTEYFATLPDATKSVFDFLNVKYMLLENIFPAPQEGDRFAIVYDGRDGKIVENRHVLPRFYAVRNVILEFNRDTFVALIREHEDWANTALLDRLQLESEAQRTDFFAPRPKDAPLARAEILDASPTDYRLRVNAPRWSLVVSSIPLWPGWKVERNGVSVQPIRVNAIFTGFAVPPGVSDVRVHYAPTSFRIGACVSLLTLLALIGYPFGVRRRKSPL